MFFTLDRGGRAYTRYRKSGNRLLFSGRGLPTLDVPIITREKCKEPGWRYLALSVRRPRTRDTALDERPHQQLVESGCHFVRSGAEER